MPRYAVTLEVNINEEWHVTAPDAEEAKAKIDELARSLMACDWADDLQVEEIEDEENEED